MTFSENVALIVLLKPKSRFFEEKLLCVATTHLLYNPKRGDCKLAQIQLFLAHLDRVSHRATELIDGKLNISYHPIILCGDFNLTSESLLYDYLSSGRLANYKEMNSYYLSGMVVQN